MSEQTKEVVSKEVEETLVELSPAVEDDQPSEISFEGWSEQEIAEAKQLGIYQEPLKEKEVGTDKKQSESTKENSTGTDEEKEEEEKVTFEDIDNNKDLLKKFTKNEQALYWKYKSDRRKRQEAEEESRELKAKVDLEGVRETAARAKLEKVKALLKDETKELTVAEVLRLIDGESAQAEKEVESVKPEDVAVKRQQERIAFMEEMGRSQYPDFDNLVALANEVVQSTPKYRKIMATLFGDPDIEPQDIIEEVVNIAKKNPKFEVPKVSAQVKEKAEKAIRNSQRSSSAAVSGSGSNKVPESQITVEMAARLTTEQWRKLSPATQKRLSMGIDP